MEVYKFLDYSYMMKQKNKEREKLLQSTNLQEIKIAVLCGATFGIIEEFLEVFLLHYGIKPTFFIGEYNRFFEEACFPNERLKEFAPDIVLIHVTNKNLLGSTNLNGILTQSLAEEQQRLIQIWEALEEQYHCVIIQNNFEYFLHRIIGNAARYHRDGVVKYIDDINQFITSYASNDNLYINDIHFLSAYVGLDNWYDDRMWSMYKYPVSMVVAPRYALNVANIIKSVLGKNKKTIITDLDNTLWGDIIGEVGVDNIKLGNETAQGEMFSLLHQHLKYLSKHGIILNICSKNEYETGMSGIHSDKSILHEEDFIIKKINWNEKYINIKEIMKQLNLYEEAAIFIDDNLVECDSVKNMIPEVEVLQMSSVGKFIKERDVLSFFELTAETREDEQRIQYYKGNEARNEQKKQYANYEEYLESLNMVCYVDKVGDKNIDRVVQLINKTNQFNFLTKRYTKEEMIETIQKQNTVTFTLELEDKFGSNGIVSVAIIRMDEAAAYIDDWVMSCRVFERGLEFVMLRLICELCAGHRIDSLYGYYRKTTKNIKIAHFFKDVGFEQKGCGQEEEVEEWICNDIGSLLNKCSRDNIELRWV